MTLRLAMQCLPLRTLILCILCLCAAPPAAAEDAEREESPPASADGDAPTPVRILPGEPPPAFRGPDVTLIAGDERMIYEYRENGQLRMIKVVPVIGNPYYLMPRDPTRGFGDLEQADALLPQWVLYRF